MAKVTTLAALSKGVTLDLDLPSLFAGSGPKQGSADLPPLILASQAARGKLNLKYNEPALPIGSRDIVKISLHGVCRTRVPVKGTVVGQMVRRYPEQQFSFLDLVHVSRVRTAAISGDHAKVDFSFVLPKVVSHLTEDLEDKTMLNRKPHWPWSSLPSSLSAEEVLTTDMNGDPQRVHAKITYTLRAQVFRRGVSIGYTAKTIRIFNDVDSQPPTCISDFPSEYQCRRQKPLRRYFRKTGGFFSATTTEPIPFVFRNTGDSASTVLPINFAFNIPSHQNTKDSAMQVPEILEATFRWQLKSLTFLSVHPFTSMPTMEQARTQSSLSMITALSYPRELKWTLTSSNDHAHPGVDSAGRALTETVRLPLVLTKPTLPPPPMFTPFIARRYNLCMRVIVVGRHTGKTNVRLEVPVQIVYRLEKGDGSDTGLPPAYDTWNEAAPEDDDIAAPVPIYSP